MILDIYLSKNNFCLLEVFYLFVFLRLWLWFVNVLEINYHFQWNALNLNM